MSQAAAFRRPKEHSSAMSTGRTTVVPTTANDDEIKQATVNFYYYSGSHLSNESICRVRSRQRLIELKEKYTDEELQLGLLLAKHQTPTFQSAEGAARVNCGSINAAQREVILGMNPVSSDEWTLCIALPWRHPETKLPNNRMVAGKCLQNLNNRIIRDSDHGSSGGNFQAGTLLFIEAKPKCSKRAVQVTSINSEEVPRYTTRRSADYANDAQLYVFSSASQTRYGALAHAGFPPKCGSAVLCSRASWCWLPIHALNYMR
ncbi:hypothetical protein PHET_03355 [Paragonimus heterotremus]|uniref:Uncharacterized protein n=1 Tax=Paragonimus heterotremus TaxID=100268 RepID=A0A8J4SRD7_9TREM|nr:hypothetical protein PHET_03355 [Paragonimus heterotremus]